MRSLQVLVITVFLVGGCATMKPNPEFSQCSKRCTAKHDACMVNATNADQVARCGDGLNSCVQACEAKHPRWIEG